MKLLHNPISAAARWLTSLQTVAHGYRLLIYSMMASLAVSASTLSAATLQHHYPLDTNGNDIVGTAHMTLQSGAVISTTAGNFAVGSGALSTAGTAYASTTANLTLGNQFSISLYSKTSDSGFAVFAATAPGGTGSPGFKWFSGRNSTRSLAWEDTQNSETVGNVIALNTTHHLVAVVNKSANNVTYYIDGVSQGSYTVANFADNLPLFLGSFAGGNFTTHNGFIDDVRIYNGLLTQQEINAIANAPTTIAATDVTETSATLNGSVNPNGEATTGWFEWGTSSTLVGATSTPAVALGSGTSGVSINHALPGLTANTTYYFRAALNNGNGNNKGSILSFFTGAEISVEHPAGAALVDGSTTVDFGDALISSPSLAKTFTIKNIGSLPLTGLSITQDGANSADFTVSAAGGTTLAPGNSVTFTVTVTPSALGARTAALHIASNDADETSFDINLTANGVAELSIIGGSDLLTPPDVVQLKAWLGETGTMTLTKIFSAAPGDGKTSNSFHAAVDGRGRTFTVIELPAQNGYVRKVIGGYNPQSWNSSSGYNMTYADSARTAFLFNLTTGLIHRQRLSNVGGGEYQTYNQSSYGPTFGGGHDLYIDSSLRGGYAYNYSYSNTSSSWTSSIFDGGQIGYSQTFARMEVFTIAFTVAPTNAAPTDIALSITSVAENQPSGTTVATITGTDPDAGQSATLTFSLVSGTGSTDNASFSIVGTSLKTAAAFNFETKSSYSIRLRATDSGSPGLTYEEAFTISVTNVNEAPADITLTPATIPENNAASATVGTLAAVDVDAADSHSFSLVAGAGDTNNANFTIDGAALKLSPSANFETQSSYSVRVQATDALGAIFAKSFTITITDVNEMPSFAKGADQSLPALIMTPQSIPGWATAINDGDSSATQTLTFNVSVTSGAALFATAPAISSDGTLTYRLGGAVGTAVVSVTLSDDNSVNGTAALTTAAQTFSITSQEAASTGHVFDDATGLSAGGFIYRPMPGVINNASQISFKAMGKVNSGGFTSANDSMLITNVSGDFQVIGQEATAAPGGGSLSGSFNNLVLSAAGQTVASEKFLGALTSADNGYVVSGDGLTLEMLSREGSAATEGGIFTGHTGRHAADDEDRIYFPGTLSGVPTTKNSGTWYDEAGTIAVLAKEGDDVGPVTGDLAWLGNFSAPLSAAGEGAAFVAALQNNPDNAAQKTPVAQNAAIFSGAPESLELVARKGDLIPAVGKLGSFSAVSRGGNGDHAFISLLTLSTATPVVAAANDQVIMAEISGVKHLVARENTTDLVGNLKPVRFGNVYMTSTGEVIYQAWLIGASVTTANDCVLCRWTLAGSNEVLAREGDSATGTGSNYLVFQGLSVSSGGAVVLQSILANGRIVLMRALPGAGLAIAVQTGTIITYEGATRSILSLGIHQTGTGAGGGGGGLGAAINDEGAILTVLSIGNSEYVTRVYRP